MKRQLPLALLALASVGFAQSQSTAELSPRSIDRITGPVQHYTLNYKTGKLAKLDGAVAVPTSKQAVAAPTYVNDCTSGSFSGTGPVDELVDWGVKAGGLTGLVDSFSFGYATDAVDTGIGGPGASVEVAFYTGTTGFGTLGTEVARFSFTGLPGASMPGFAGFILTVTDADFCLPDGPIGYGYCSSDAGTTGPLLIDETLCAANGITTGFDVYTCPGPVGGYVGTFTFGSTPSDDSFFMVINEDDGTEVATTAVNNGSGANPILASDGGVPAVLGGTWPVTIDNTAGYTTSVGLMTVGSLPPGTLFLVGGEVIVDVTNPNGFVLTNNVLGAGINDHSEAVPKTLSLLGVDLTFQGLLFGGITPYQLTNGIDLHVGF